MVDSHVGNVVVRQANARDLSRAAKYGDPYTADFTVRSGVLGRPGEGVVGLGVSRSAVVSLRAALALSVEAPPNR